MDLKKDSCVAGGVEVGMMEVVVDDDEGEEAIEEAAGESDEEDAEAGAAITIDEEVVDGFDTSDVLFDHC